MDTSRRNNLLYFRDLKVGALDVSEYRPSAMSALLAGETVALSRLLPDADEIKAPAKLREIGKRALANQEEKGLQTLFLALGMATWPAADDGRPPEAAVLLVPLAIESVGQTSRSLALKRAGDPRINLTLLHLLEIEYGCEIEAEALLSGAEEAEETLDPAAVSARLADAASSIDGFEVRPRAVIGNFSFQKMAMVKDLQERAAEMAANDLIAAICGDVPARDTIRSRHGEVDPQEIDRTPPDNEFLVLDADSSQQRAIAAILRGQSGVIQGPPGTGKSQTIVNLLTSLAAQGKRVLFVAEKRAALEVVLRRLEEVGLGHLALDLHGADISQRALMARLRQTLTMVREAAPVAAESVHSRFTDRRTRLNTHVARMHAPRPPSGLSAFELQGRLLRLPPEAHTDLRWRGPELSRLDDVAATAVRDLLKDASAFASLLRRDDPSPWTGATLRDGTAVQQAMDLAERLAREGLPAMQETLARLTGAAGLRAPGTLQEARLLIDLLTEIETTLSLYKEDLYREDLESLANDLVAAERGAVSVALSMLTSGAFRGARRTLRSLRKADPAPITTLLSEVRAAADQRRRYRAFAASDVLPKHLPELQTARRDLEAVEADLLALKPALPSKLPDLPSTDSASGASDAPPHRTRTATAPTHLSSSASAVGASPTGSSAIGASASSSAAAGAGIDGIPLERLTIWMGALAADRATPYRLPRLLEIEREIEQRGAGTLLAEIRTHALEPDRWAERFDAAWISSCLDEARRSDAALAGFHGATHNGFVEEFRALDRTRLELSAARVRRAHGERVIAAMNAHKEQADLVRREVEKTRKRLPLRKLAAQAPEVLTTLCPWWMASPLSVSQLLDADQRYFDVVLFDEASQVLPEDAIPALLRASQVVVAGDRHQLPPTTFFADGGPEGEEENEATEGFESLLDLLRSFLEPWPLDWHYRSRDETLIAFSNRHIYGDRLITFPGAGGAPCLSHELVVTDMDRDGEEESVSAEVRRVVELVIEHAERRPHETLGVIAMGIKHAQRIEAVLEGVVQDRPELHPFFDPDRPDRFFIKNLERVQGDERDAILLTVGYGKDRSGRLPYRFGPLLSEGGERRLNVAITRARRRMTVVSSFSHLDMDPGRSKARGVELLRLYLQYAAGQGRNLGDAGLSGTPLNPFEADVYDALTARGLALLPQWGASRFRIDLVAQHPTKPGRLVLAIECDGATYHSAPSARDRDRLRQQLLEALGWRFHRIWSTEWFLHREEEIARAVAAYERAVEHADHEDALGEAPEEAEGEDDVVDTPEPTEPEPEMPAVRERAPLSQFMGVEIGNLYAPTRLMGFVRWIESDGRLRTDDEILTEMLPLLGLKRRGPRAVAAILDAIERVRRSESGK